MSQEGNRLLKVVTCIVASLFACDALRRSLVSATILTLILLPLVYDWMAGKERSARVEG